LPSRSKAMRVPSVDLTLCIVGSFPVGAMAVAALERLDRRRGRN
jgi:hypothetical protein